MLLIIWKSLNPTKASKRLKKYILAQIHFSIYMYPRFHFDKGLDVYITAAIMTNDRLKNSLSTSVIFLEI